MLSRRNKRALLGFAAVLLILAVIISGVARFFEAQNLADQLEEERAALRPPEPLIVTAERRSLSRERAFAARLEPWAMATLMPEVAGTVIRIGAELGEIVSAGAELLVLDSSLVRPTLAAAEVQAAEAARRAAEVAVLAAGNVVSPSDRAAAQAAADAATQEVLRLREHLARHTLRAPFAGSVQRRHVERGDAAGPGQPAYVLVDTSRLRAVFHVSATERASLLPGTEIRVEAGPAGTPPLTARVRFLAPAAGPDGRFRVEAVLDPAPPEAPAGSAVIARATIRTHVDTLFVPAAAVRFDGAKPVVRRLDAAGVETQVVVEISPEIDGQHPVRSGLNEGDRLVIR